MTAGDRVIIRAPGFAPEPAVVLHYGGHALGCVTTVKRAGHVERYPTHDLRPAR